MAQNIYDNSEFFAGYSQLARSVCGLDGAPEWPSIRALLPDLHGKRVIDLGCGFGWFARWARQHGAESVLGLDVSERMIARATASTDDENIRYVIADLERVELPEAEFDLAYSSLALHYIEDFARLIGHVHRSLRPGGRFIFSIEHPIYMAPMRPGWSVDEDGCRTWPINRYSVEGSRSTDWFAKGVLKQHRTIGTTLNTLIGAGFVVRHVQEWAPTAEQLAVQPDLADEVERPMMLIVSAQR
ncbi:MULTISPECIES: class I SAM-dependent methyltransferase [unclassified Bradyrhizobium]|uniref:class I SAM-dependent methyltransferase n=1 Tax=unclassified Bradyrhizobium TaxID=2631580 RepID=UPI002478ED97|nr:MULTISPECIES: class I SAM-dependent methyltransferase [unclassified Bradyrhizobium]WGR68303.1 class I SAM-dependent methyltransferase [Bradyrhizobium sp. ISRA426]WGR80358.1 class I SAM-dependent methyltransferase [Bradyrhizobium sp. ISRA430]WGR83543.1 class I SAM-dependent methyltransferase [Bradyrhizobium sp. ISRA432]